MYGTTTKYYIEHWVRSIEDQIRFKIEEFPSSILTKSRQERSDFYKTLSSCPKEVVEPLLSSICMLIVEQHAEHDVQCSDLYWGKYEELEKMVQKICQHDLVRNWSGVGSIELFSPQHFRCKHGKTIRFRKKCLTIRTKLELFRSFQGLLEKLPKRGLTRSRKFVENAQGNLLEWLSRTKVDAQTANLDDYCRPDPLNFEEDNSRLTLGESMGRRKPGRQVKQFQNMVISRLMPLLRRCYANSSAAGDTLETVLWSFFGLKVESESLERQWRRLAEKKPKRKS